MEEKERVSNVFLLLILNFGVWLVIITKTPFPLDFGRFSHSSLFFFIPQTTHLCNFTFLMCGFGRLDSTKDSD